MIVNEIAGYIITKYKDSCLACNSLEYNYSEDELVAECVNFFYHEQLHWCGCGNPELAQRCIRDYLDIVSGDDVSLRKEDKMKARFGVANVYESELLLCLAYSLDAAGLTEHGTGIGGAWLTDEGKMFLDVLKMHKDLDN